MPTLVIGSIPTPLTWHGLWLRLIDDTTTARGALASALTTRTLIVTKLRVNQVGLSEVKLEIAWQIMLAAGNSLGGSCHG
jgi:hypothetical protein